VLWRRDLACRDATLSEDDRLRVPSAFTFREAKQSWGLEEVMNVPHPARNTAANRAVFLVTGAHLLLKPCRKNPPTFGLLDWQASFRGHKSGCEPLKRLPQNPEPMVLAPLFDHLARLGRVHPAERAPIML
jgi:putative transposase